MKQLREKYLGLILPNKVGVFANQLVTSSSPYLVRTLPPACRAITI